MFSIHRIWLYTQIHTHTHNVLIVFLSLNPSQWIILKFIQFSFSIFQFFFFFLFFCNFLLQKFYIPTMFSSSALLCAFFPHIFFVLFFSTIWRVLCVVWWKFFPFISWLKFKNIYKQKNVCVLKEFSRSLVVVEIMWRQVFNIWDVLKDDRTYECILKWILLPRL